MKTLFFTLWAFFSITAYSSTLSEVKAKDELSCGVSGSLLGFSKEDTNGKYYGFDVDYCRAVASAIGVSKVKFVNLTAKERLGSLKSGEVDILSRTTTWTLSRDTDGFDFVGTIFYDGEGFMVPTEFVFKEYESFTDASFCLREGTTSSQNLNKFFTPKGIKYKEKVYPNKDAVTKAYLAGDCQIYVLDTSALMSLKASLPSPEKHKILDIKISKEPLSPVVRDNDAQWLDITRWTLFLLIQLEEKGINQLSNQDSRAIALKIT
ncbi:MAG: transporter substrate-binding domain-containing protein [Colwellia sp.]|nr:transporter substrate-binding domain-containing protein [Colwellia sp.]